MLILDLSNQSKAVLVVIGRARPLALGAQKFPVQGVPHETLAFHAKLKHLCSCTMQIRDYYGLI